MKTLTKAEVLHVRRALANADALLEEYPEVYTDETEDDLKIAKEIMHEDTNTRY